MRKVELLFTIRGQSLCANLQLPSAIFQQVKISMFYSISLFLIFTIIAVEKLSPHSHAGTRPYARAAHRPDPDVHTVRRVPRKPTQHHLQKHHREVLATAASLFKGILSFSLYLVAYFHLFPEKGERRKEENQKREKEQR